MVSDFEGGKILHCATDLSHQKSKYMFNFWLGSAQKGRIFFFLATLHSQKLVKKIAYIPTSFSLHQDNKERFSHHVSVSTW